MAASELWHSPQVWWPNFPPALTSIRQNYWVDQNVPFRHTPMPLSPSVTWLSHLGTDSTLKRQLWVASMESTISPDSQVSSGHHRLGSLWKFYTLPSRAHPCWSPFSDSIPTRHLHQLPPRCPWQQMLPASFWSSNQTISPIFLTPKVHMMDLTGKKIYPHWQRKWLK